MSKPAIGMAKETKFYLTDNSQGECVRFVSRQAGYAGREVLERCRPDHHSGGTLFGIFVDGYDIVLRRKLPYNTENPLLSAYDAPGFAAGQIIAEVLSQEAPRDNLLIPEYISSDFDAHPNGEAGAAVASAFLAWYGMGAS
ncbi:hypothetical protein [Paenibacillus harenae]|uniref:hypothetical protein n=1 Tax=Paenibacillus harenae TaxID=306543 RepID=UPI0027D80002|nr:hypothetical protein [Paenibacillus harenae]